MEHRHQHAEAQRRSYADGVGFSAAGCAGAGVGRAALGSTTSAAGPALLDAQDASTQKVAHAQSEMDDLERIASGGYTSFRADEPRLGYKNRRWRG